MWLQPDHHLLCPPQCKQTVFTIFTLENNVQQLQQMANMLMKFSALFHAGLLNKTQPNTDEGHGG